MNHRVASDSATSIMCHFQRLQVAVLMDSSDLLVEPLIQRVELRSVLEEFGAQCVMTTGEQMMLKWPADNWDMLHMVITLDYRSLLSLTFIQQ